MGFRKPEPKKNFDRPVTQPETGGVEGSTYRREVTGSGYAGHSTFLRTAPAYKVKVKVTLVQALRLCTGRTAHRGCRGIALPFHDHGIRRG